MRPPAIPLLWGLVGVDLVFAGATWLGWELTGTAGLPHAVAVLLVASPLGLLIAQHTPLLVARRLARRDGITHLGSSSDRALPRLRQLVIEVDHVVTTGGLVVVEVVPLDVRHKHDLRWFAGALAHGSSDPVARAIGKLATRGRPVDVSEGQAHELAGAVDRHPVRFGLKGARGANAGVEQVVGTTVRVDVDLRPMGHITVADEVREDATRCLSILREEGIEPILVSASMREPDLARVCEQVGVRLSHPGSDAATIAGSLPRPTTGVLRAVATPESSGVAGETTLPGHQDGPGQDATVRCTDPSIAAALGSFQHLRCLRRSRRVAQACAVAVILLATPPAAAGFLSLMAAAVVACVAPMLVAAVATSVVLLGAPAPVGDL